MQEKAGVGFEPTNRGFAIRSLRPLGHPAGVANNIATCLPNQTIEIPAEIGLQVFIINLHNNS